MTAESTHRKPFGVDPQVARLEGNFGLAMGSWMKASRIVSKEALVVLFMLFLLFLLSVLFLVVILVIIVMLVVLVIPLILLCSCYHC